ncbi:MAG: DUF3109 family protein [Salibacteraceae bacterium]
MIQIDDTIVSLELLQKKFVCDLSACKGACCVEGDEGAPLEDAERDELDLIYEKVKPFLRPEGIAAIEEQGTWVRDQFDEDYVTPLVNEQECAYVTFDDKGTALCGIEQAYRAGVVDFYKPISCHLYPIRISKYQDFEALNYDQWKICDPARSCGMQLEVKVYRFLKPAIIRKYGEEYYTKLEAADELAKNLVD